MVYNPREKRWQGLPSEGCLIAYKGDIIPSLEYDYGELREYEQYISGYVGIWWLQAWPKEAWSKQR